MRSPVVVRLVGAHLDCLAWESFLSGAPAVLVSHEPAEARPGVLTLLIGLPCRSSSFNYAEEPPRSGMVLITRGAAAELLQAVLLGVEVLVSPEDSLPMLMEALCAAVSAKSYCSPRLLPALLEVIRSRSAVAVSPNGGLPPASLSPREEEIAALVATGLTNGQVARQLHVEERTVKSHLTSVYSKLTLAGRNDLRARWPDLPKRYV